MTGIDTQHVIGPDNCNLSPEALARMEWAHTAPDHPSLKRLKRHLKQSRKNDRACYRLTWSLFPDIPCEMAVAGYSIREYDLCPIHYSVPVERSRLFTAAEVAYLCNQKHSFKIVMEEPAVPLLTAPPVAGLLPARVPVRKPEIKYIPVPAMRDELPVPAGYFPQQLALPWPVIHTCYCCGAQGEWDNSGREFDMPRYCDRCYAAWQKSASWDTFATQNLKGEPDASAKV